MSAFYIGYRKYGGDRSFVSVGVGSTCYQAVTFASEFVKHILSGSVFFPADKVDLSAVKIFGLQDGVQIGWPVDLERCAFEGFHQCAGNRPIKNPQGWSKPWTC